MDHNSIPMARNDQINRQWYLLRLLKVLRVAVCRISPNLCRPNTKKLCGGPARSRCARLVGIFHVEHLSMGNVCRAISLYCSRESYFRWSSATRMVCAWRRWRTSRTPHRRGYLPRPGDLTKET